MRRLYQGIVRLSLVLNGIATFWLFSMMIIIVSDVLSRFFFNQPLTGTAEIVKMSIVGITFIQLPHTVYVDRVIRSDSVLNRMWPVPRAIVTMISYLMGIGLVLAIIFSSWSHTMQSWKIFEYVGEGSLHVPVYPIRTFIILGSAIMCVHFFVKILGCLEIVGDHFGKKGKP